MRFADNKSQVAKRVRRDIDMLFGDIRDARRALLESDIDDASLRLACEGIAKAVEMLSDVRKVLAPHRVELNHG